MVPVISRRASGSANLAEDLEDLFQLGKEGILRP